MIKKIYQNKQKLGKNKSFLITHKNNLNICIGLQIVQSLVSEKMVFDIGKSFLF